MSGNPDRREEGLFASLKSVSATVLAMGQTRLELLGNEIETQKLLALRILMLAQALLFCAGVGVVLLVMLLVVLAGEQRVGPRGMRRGLRAGGNGVLPLPDAGGQHTRTPVRRQPGRAAGRHPQPEGGHRPCKPG